MRSFILFLSFFFVSASWANISLQVGDILLQPLHCRLCYLIEEEENSRYSHMGVVLQTSPEVLIGEAWGSVGATPIKTFLQKTKKGEKLKVLRFRSERIQQHILEQKEEFFTLFKNEFSNLSYDESFLWNNLDENGREMLYCSEFVSKLFQAFMRLEMPIKRMHYLRNRDQWSQYFRGNIPDGEWGNSPADFERSELFHSLGNYEK